MTGLSFGGLASGLDTDTIIQQLMSIESRPLTALSRQKSDLLGRIDIFKDLNTRINALETAAFELTKISSVVSRKATSSKTDTLMATANGDATPGNYSVEILRLATATTVHTGTDVGQGNSQGGIADTSAFSTDTVNQINIDNRLNAELTQGTFFVNGQQVLVANTDTLDAILTKISTATSGNVTASLVTDPVKGQVLQLSSATQISVSNGTSNFLSAFNLDTASYASGILSSSDTYNAVRSDVDLDGSDGSANLAQAVGSGTLTINGTTITYNSTDDSLNDIISRITASQAGVRATFSNVGGGRVTLNSKNNGPLAVSISDTGNLANALGLNASDSQTMGESAQVRIDGGVVQSFNKNTGITAAGIDGVLLDLRAADPGNPVTVTVANNGTVATDKVKNFVDQYNNVISAIDQLTSYDPESGQKGALLTDSSVKSIKNRLSEMVFSRVSGLSGSNPVGSLTELGFNTGPLGSNVGTTSTLQIDTAKLQKALEDDPIRVAQLLGAADTTNGEQGVMEKIKSYLEGVSSISGFINQRELSLNTQVTSITERINSLSSRLNTKQIALEHKFTNLEMVIAKMQAQQNSLAGLFRNN